MFRYLPAPPAFTIFYRVGPNVSNLTLDKMARDALTLLYVAGAQLEVHRQSNTGVTACFIF
jgi:hypothetical protein